MVDFQAYRQDRPQGLKKNKKTFKNLGLVAAQCNDIEACVYSFKKYLQYGTYTTVQYMVCCIKTSFIFVLNKWAPNNPV